MIFGTWNPAKIWHENLTGCPPHLSDVATLPWEIQKEYFQQCQRMGYFKCQCGCGVVCLQCSRLASFTINTPLWKINPTMHSVSKLLWAIFFLFRPGVSRRTVLGGLCMFSGAAKERQGELVSTEKRQRIVILCSLLLHTEWQYSTIQKKHFMKHTWSARIWGAGSR